MKIQKLKIYKRPLNMGRKARGNFVIGGYSVKSPFQKPVSKQGGETIIHSPIHSPFERTKESIQREQQRDTQRQARQKEEIRELKRRSSVAREKARIEESKYRQHRAKRARRTPIGQRSTSKRRTSYSGRPQSYEQQMESKGYRYNVASGTWERRPTGRYNVASGMYE